MLTLNDVVNCMATMLRRLIGPEIEFEIALRPTRRWFGDPRDRQVVLKLSSLARTRCEGRQVTVSVDHVELDETRPPQSSKDTPGPYER